MMASHRRVLPSSLIKPVIGRAFAVCTDAEQRAERIERIEPAVKAERELVEVGLQVFRLNAPVMRSLQPSLQVRKDKVNDRQKLFGHVRVATLDHGQMRVAALAERCVGRGRIGNDHRTRLNGGIYKAAQGLFATVWNDFKAKAASVAPAAPHGLVALLGRAGADLDGGADQHLILPPAPSAA